MIENDSNIHIYYIVKIRLNKDSYNMSILYIAKFITFNKIR